jgi:hypothetical protein
MIQLDLRPDDGSRNRLLHGRSVEAEPNETFRWPSAARRSKRTEGGRQGGVCLNRRWSICIDASDHQLHPPTPVVLWEATLAHEQDYPVLLFSSNRHNEVNRIPIVRWNLVLPFSSSL